MTNPWAPPSPPPRRPLDRSTVATGVVLAAVLFAGVLSLTGRVVANGVRARAAADRAAVAQEQAAERAAEDALNRPADTARVKAAKDGSRTFRSSPPEPDQHGYTIRLPKGWEGRYVGARDNDVTFSDAILTKPGHGTAIVVDRLELGFRVDDRAFLNALVAKLATEEPPLDVTAQFRPATFAAGDRGVVLDGTMENGATHLRIVLFEHAGEAFRVDLATPVAERAASVKDLDKMLASWRWG